MADMTSAETAGHHDEGQTRRDFLVLLGNALGAVGAGAAAVALIDTMNPSADVLAAGSPVDVDISKLDPGQQIVVMWRGKPIFLVNRSQAALDRLKTPDVLSRLRDPDSSVHQQPPYAQNAYRSVKPEYLVLVGICTHLGCIPRFFPQPSQTDPAPDWPGGYFCPCHGSKYDLAGRVYKGVPAPYNLPVPPYNFTGPKTLRIGVNPPGVTYDLDSVVQI